MSGLSRTPGKRVWANPHRGFESRPLRQKASKQAPLGALFCFYLPSFLPSGLRLDWTCWNAVGHSRVADWSYTTAKTWRRLGYFRCKDLRYQRADRLTASCTAGNTSS